MEKIYRALDEDQWIQLVRHNANVFKKGAVIYLLGDLGAGKTTTARALIQALGYPDRVKSPTYSLLETYKPLGLSIAHLDLYRLADASEVLDLGLEELVAENASLLLVEWPEKGGEYLPKADVLVELSIHDASDSYALRDIRLLAKSDRGATVLSEWK